MTCFSPITIARSPADCFAAEDAPRASALAVRCGMTAVQLTRTSDKTPAEFRRSLHAEAP